MGAAGSSVPGSAARPQQQQGVTLLLDAPAATHAAGLALGRALPARAVVLCEGGLGAGKTTLIKAVCEALGIAPQRVISPTYTLVNVYPGPRSVYHVDLYRLQEADPDASLAAATEALLGLDREDWVNPDGVTLVEWPAAARPLLAGEPVLELALETVPGRPEARRLRVQGDDPGFAPVLEALRRLPGAEPAEEGGDPAPAP